ncbi:sigma-70 family RNA polymerase sigma factor [Pelagicoccus sp. NFK12]|uniref:Sigma-70 family RNA polymerase sigma factor n=1 Tax=Pelagicoccus enzymogenes TaxID=2773457 RepID=A0A927FC98_9BACT|nr:sigma-70 family RNA polymerase sigma factor [Pelagicoccus enzymogenes]MBD5782483.1 sigma-70 family RNA polymerase sigma factor [Pelagicoccus enzymogenes]
MVRLFEKYDSETNADSDPDPDELLIRMGNEDESAFESFYYSFRGIGMTFILEIVNDHGKAEEIFNDAMLKLYSYSSSFDTRNGAALALFKVIAKRTAIDRIRRKNFICFTDDPYCFGSAKPLYDSDRSPDSEVELASNLEELRGAIEQLSPTLKRPIKMFCETGMSYPQIAAKLQLPLASVKTSMRRGIIALRALTANESRPHRRANYGSTVTMTRA